MFRQRKGSRPEPDPRQMYDALRSQVITADPAKMGLRPQPPLTQVWGALLELGMVGATATAVSLADGTTSLYPTAVEDNLDGFVADPGDDLPAENECVIRALTYDGRRVSRAPELLRDHG